MQIQKLYYKWDDSFSELPINLGNEKTSLLAHKLIHEQLDEISFIGTNPQFMQVKFENELVSQVWVKMDTDEALSYFNLSSHFIDAATQDLDAKYESLNLKTNKPNVDALLAIFRDGILSIIAILKGHYSS